MSDYLLPGVIILFVVWRVLSSILVRRRIPGLRREGAQLVDVRGPGEFASGHAPGSLNIPLQDLAEGSKDLDRGRWVVVCCASGTRSAFARRTLRRMGFERVLNAGSWRNLC